MADPAKSKPKGGLGKCRWDDDNYEKSERIAAELKQNAPVEEHYPSATPVLQKNAAERAAAAKAASVSLGQGSEKLEGTFAFQKPKDRFNVPVDRKHGGIEASIYSKPPPVPNSTHFQARRIPAVSLPAAISPTTEKVLSQDRLNLGDAPTMPRKILVHDQTHNPPRSSPQFEKERDGGYRAFNTLNYVREKFPPPALMNNECSSQLPSVTLALPATQASQSFTGQDSHGQSMLPRRNSASEKQQAARATPTQQNGKDYVEADSSTIIMSEAASRPNVTMQSASTGQGYDPETLPPLPSEKNLAPFVAKIGAFTFSVVDINPWKCANCLRYRNSIVKCKGSINDHLKGRLITPEYVEICEKVLRKWVVGPRSKPLEETCENCKATNNERQQARWLERETINCYPSNGSYVAPGDGAQSIVDAFADINLPPNMQTSRAAAEIALNETTLSDKSPRKNGVHVVYPSFKHDPGYEKYEQKMTHKDSNISNAEHTTTHATPPNAERLSKGVSQSLVTHTCILSVENSGLQEELEEILNENEALHKNHRELGVKFEKVKGEKMEAEKQIVGLKNAIAGDKKSAEDAISKYESANQDLEDYKHLLEEANSRVATLQETVKELRADLRKEKRAVDDLQTKEINTLKGQMAEFEKRLLQAKVTENPTTLTEKLTSTKIVPEETRTEKPITVVQAACGVCGRYQSTPSTWKRLIALAMIFFVVFNALPAILEKGPALYQHRFKGILQDPLNTGLHTTESQSPWNYSSSSHSLLLSLESLAVIPPFATAPEHVTVTQSASEPVPVEIPFNDFYEKVSYAFNTPQKIGGWAILGSGLTWLAYHHGGSLYAHFR